MESSPFAGYVKAAAFGILAFTVFVAFWQRTKVEDKIVALDQANQGIVDKINEMSAESRASAKETAKLRGRIESLIKVMNKRPVVVGTQPPTNGGGPAEDEPSTDIDDDEPMSGGEDWGWGLNAEIDQDLDPSRPVGAPGRYKNFLRLDPDPITHPEGVNRNGTLNFPWSSEPAGFNFILQTYATLSDYCEAYTMSSPASRHRKRPSSFNWSPDLCWRVEVSPDYKEFTLFFRKDAFWHKPPIDVRKYPHLAGKHQVTAHDLKFALDIITNPNTGKGAASLRSYYNELDGCDVIDDYTAVIRWKKTLWTNLSWSMGCYVMPRFVYEYDEGGNKYPKETVGQEFTNHWYDALRAGPVGHGPYRFVKYEEGKYIRLERWDEWFGFKDVEPYPIRYIHQKIYEDVQVAMTWVKAGETDISGLSSSFFRAEVLEGEPDSPFKDGSITVYTAPRTAYLFFAWKNSDPLFRDKRVRQALTYACDRAQICKKIWLDRYAPMSAPIYPYSEEASPGLKPYPFDLAKARELLDAAGWKLNPGTGLREKVIDGSVTQFKFQLHFPSGSSDFVSTLNHYKNDLLKIGVQLEPMPVQWATYQQEQRDRKYRAFSMLWATPGWEHDFRQIWHSDGIEDPASSNFAEYSNKELDGLQDELRETMDPKKRVEIVRRIGAILHEDQPYTFFGWSKTFRAYWNHIHGVQENPYFIRPLIRFFPMWSDK